jgi:hypothetical protein
MKYLFIILSLLFIINSNAQFKQDSLVLQKDVIGIAFTSCIVWSFTMFNDDIPTDKKWHLTFSYGMSSTVGYFLRDKKWYLRLLAQIPIILLEYGKELYDDKYRYGFSQEDMKFNLIGNSIGILITL